MKDKTLIINMYGGPGSGKSTLMAGLFAYLKNRGINCEMAPEYAKEKVWEESFRVLDNQLYVFAKQHHRISRLIGKVNVIITDSPLLLSLYYGGDKSKEFNDLVISEFRKTRHMDIFVKRCKPYNPKGRNQTEKEAKLIDKKIKAILDGLSGGYEVLKGEEASIKLLGDLILSHKFGEPC